MTSSRSRASVLFLVGVLTASGCAESGPDSGQVVVDSSSAHIRVVNPAPARLSSVTTRELVPVLELGSLDGPHDAFGGIVAVERSDDGHLYVADASASEVVVFDEEGAWVRTIGGPGEGPGEFGMISGIRLDPSGLLWVMDALRRRLTAFDGRGDLVGTVLRDDLSRNVSIPWGGEFDADGRLLDLRSMTDPESGTLREIVWYRLAPERYEASRAVRLPTVSTPMYEQSSADGALRMRSPVPHGPRQRWAPAGPGQIWLTDSTELTLHRLAQEGDTTLTVSVDVDPVRLSGGTRDSLAAVTGLSLTDIPEHRRVVRNLVPGAGGAVWVLAEIGSNDGALEWYRIDPDGLVTSRAPHRLPEVGESVHPIIRGDHMIMSALCEGGIPCVIVAAIEEVDSGSSR